MAKIGILGGTFDPIHNGHIELAKAAYEQHNLDKIWIMVSPTPPHKADKFITNIKHRCNMVKIAIKDYNYMEFSDFELNRKGYVYTAETLTLLEEQYPNDTFYFIVGGDSLACIDRWYKPEVVLSKCVLLAATRSGSGDIDKLIKEKREKYNADIKKIKFENIDISSTEIKDINNEKTLRKLVNNKVADYILTNCLYEFAKVYDDMYFRGLRKEVRQKMSKHRHEHTIGVEMTAAALAMRYEPSIINKARIAGILHDCAKSLKDAEAVKLCEKHNINISDYEYNYPHMLHGATGAIVAKKEFNIDDPDILSAIYYHTVGRPNMTLLDKIIFIADYIEPGRNQAPNLEYLRKLSFTDIDEAVLRITEGTLNYLVKSKTPINKKIYEVLDFYKELYERKNEGK